MILIIIIITVCNKTMVITSMELVKKVSALCQTITTSAHLPELWGLYEERPAIIFILLLQVYIIILI